MRLRGAVGCGRASVGAGFAHALSPVGAATFVAAALAGRRAVAITATAALLAARGCGRVVTADCAAFLACVLVVEPLALGLGLDALARRELRAGEESRLRLILVDPAFALAYHRTLAILAAVAPGVAISRTVAVPVAVADTIAVKRTFASAADCTYETETLLTAAALTKAAYESLKALEDALADAKAEEDAHKAADICKDKVLPRMSELRASVDALEILTATGDWPYPSYGDMLFNVR